MRLKVSELALQNIFCRSVLDRWPRISKSLGPHWLRQRLASCGTWQVRCENGWVWPGAHDMCDACASNFKLCCMLCLYLYITDWRTHLSSGTNITQRLGQFRNDICTGDGQAKTPILFSTCYDKMSIDAIGKCLRRWGWSMHVHFKNLLRGANLPKETDGGARLRFGRMDFCFLEAGQQRNTSCGVWRTDGWSSLWPRAPQWPPMDLAPMDDPNVNKTKHLCDGSHTFHCAWNCPAKFQAYGYLLPVVQTPIEGNNHLKELWHWSCESHTQDPRFVVLRKLNAAK